MSIVKLQKENLDIRSQFPALQNDVVFLDSAASAQKPHAVLEAMKAVVEGHYANVHRGLYKYSQETTNKFEQARGKVAGFLNANSENEIVFTRNTTEAINLVAATWGRRNLKSGDEIILTELEHHANIVPWQMLRDEIGFEIKVIPIQKDGTLDFNVYKSMLSDKTKLVAVTHMSNALGTIVPVKEITALAKTVGAMVLVDGSQAVVHLDVDVQEIGCDFYVFTGHKLYGPTGIGVLWGWYEILETLPPYQGGGEMIERVTFEKTTFKVPPARFEAGTPAIVEAIGLGVAIDFVQDIGIEAIQAHEEGLLSYATEQLSGIDGLEIYGPALDCKAGVIAFNVDGVHPSDVGTILDQCHVAVRCGHHCAQPLMQALGVTATVRASFGIYNTHDDVNHLVEGLKKVKDIFK